MSDFESRKSSHLDLALKEKNQSSANRLHEIQLIPEALPTINFSEVTTALELFGEKLSNPFFISSMTAGHEKGQALNLALAKIAEKNEIFFAVGSQRGELLKPETLGLEWKQLYKECPQLKLIGNIGATQLTEYSIDRVLALIENSKAKAFYVHLNALQEVIQVEGTPNFRCVEEKLQELCKKSSVPILVKEVGCGITLKTAQRLFSLGVRAVDLAGSGGTHWGRIEGDRAGADSVRARASQVFADWGISAVDTLEQAGLQKMQQAGLFFASGGVRSGLDVAKYLVLGAQAVGVAKPFLEAALKDIQQGSAQSASLNHLQQLIDQYHFELKASLFLVNAKNLSELRESRSWQWAK